MTAQDEQVRQQAEQEEREEREERAKPLVIKKTIVAWTIPGQPIETI